MKIVVFWPWMPNQQAIFLTQGFFEN